MDAQPKDVRLRREKLVSVRFLLIYIPRGVLIGVLLSIALWNSASSPTHGVSIHRGSPLSVSQHTSAQSSKVSPTAMIVYTTAQRYMRALLDQNYGVMWSLLHPQMQTKWPSEEAFAHFWQARFHDYNLKSFTLGQVRHRSFWVDPETMVQYNQVEELRVSLQLSPKDSAQPATLLPHEDVYPSQVMRNLPFIAQHIATKGDSVGQWF